MPTVPSLLAAELATNPFLRTNVESVVAAAQDYTGKTLTTEAQVFRALREWKAGEYD